jgi:hypothetical protein
MSKIAISGAATGTATFTIESPATSTNRTLTLPDNTGTIITQNSTPAFASTIGVGGATAAASGAGITFPATQSASSDANTLDDYEEGTFTPGFQNIGTGTYGTLQGAYTKIGNVVTIELTASMATLGTASGQIIITGLPFTPRSGLNQSTNRIWTNGWAANAQNVIGLFGGSTTIDFYKTAASGLSSNAVHSDIGATGNVVVSCSYLI